MISENKSELFHDTGYETLPKVGVKGYQGLCQPSDEAISSPLIYSSWSGEGYEDVSRERTHDYDDTANSEHKTKCTGYPAFPWYNLHAPQKLTETNDDTSDEKVNGPVSVMIPDEDAEEEDAKEDYDPVASEDFDVLYIPWVNSTLSPPALPKREVKPVKESNLTEVHNRKRKEHEQVRYQVFGLIREHDGIASSTALSDKNEKNMKDDEEKFQHFADYTQSVKLEGIKRFPSEGRYQINDKDNTIMSSCATSDGLTSHEQNLQPSYATRDGLNAATTSREQRMLKTLPQLRTTSDGLTPTTTSPEHHLRNAMLPSRASSDDHYAATSLREQRFFKFYDTIHKEQGPLKQTNENSDHIKERHGIALKDNFAANNDSKEHNKDSSQPQSLIENQATVALVEQSFTELQLSLSPTKRETNFQELYTKIISTEKVPYTDLLVIDGQQYGSHEELLDAILESEDSYQSDDPDENGYYNVMHGYG
ncbi:uncharacterized protein [Amphiura filiformis]|uniref:uncharacterized protein n=1 Tax=Amphiura filiformis TaxID=82378 RepID=UPI003B216F2A